MWDTIWTWTHGHTVTHGHVLEAFGGAKDRLGSAAILQIILVKLFKPILPIAASTSTSAAEPFTWLVMVYFFKVDVQRKRQIKL